MSAEKTAGLLLQSIPYLGQKRILKILTPETGLLTFMAKRNTAAALTTPFALAEWVYEKQEREIHPLQDGTILDDLASLKQEYACLTAAGRLAQDLLRTQLPGKAAHEVFALALACFRKLPLFRQPDVLVAAFRLKLLALEGLVSDLPPALGALLHAKSFLGLASFPKEERVCREVDRLFEELLLLV